MRIRRSQRGAGFPCPPNVDIVHRWIYCDGGISQHGLWSSRGNHENLRRIVGKRVSKVPERSVFLFLNHLKIGDGGV